jgi:hypothetical protein
MPRTHVHQLAGRDHPVSPGTVRLDQQTLFGSIPGALPRLAFLLLRRQGGEDAQKALLIATAVLVIVDGRVDGRVDGGLVSQGAPPAIRFPFGSAHHLSLRPMRAEADRANSRRFRAAQLGVPPTCRRPSHYRPKPPHWQEVGGRTECGFARKLVGIASAIGASLASPGRPTSSPVPGNHTRGGPGLRARCGRLCIAQYSFCHSQYFDPVDLPSPNVL